MIKRNPSVSHEDSIVSELRDDPEYAAQYLRAAQEDLDEPRTLLLVLRHLARARGISAVARKAGIERESLYRALSARGNPRFSTILAITSALGLKLRIEPARARTIRARSRTS